ncbi:MAG: N-acetylmuramoyl-L-alanine amidase family protein, partial [Desulfobulbaceae bacterium]
MTTPNPNTTRLKNNILRGVYDENLRINDVRFDTQKASRSSSARSFILLAMALLVVGGSVLLYRLLPLNEPGKGLPSSPVATAVQEFEPLPTTTVEVQVPVPVAVPTSVTAHSFILQPPEASGVAISKERLLDYSFALNNDQMRLSSIFGLDVQTIVIDPGHGGMDGGAVGAMGTKEKDVVLDIARRLRERLLASGRYNVLLTREGDSSMTLAERVDKVNGIHADLFISLHVNALPQKKANVIETFYYGPPTDEETLRIAEQENRGSGIPASEFDTMIKKIGNTFKEQESATLASAIQHSLFTNAKKYDKDMADAGIKIAPFVVLLGVNAPSVLVEISCISKKQEELKLNLPAYREEITSFLAEGTTRYLARKNLHIVQGEENDEKVR